MTEPVLTKHVTFVLMPDGDYDIQLWPPGMKPLNGKTYVVKIPVPAELVGQAIQASILTPDRSTTK